MPHFENEKLENTFINSAERIVSEPSEKKQKPKKTYRNRTRNKNFALRFTFEEYEMLEEKRRKTGLTRADFILNLAKKGKIIVVPDLTEIRFEQHKQGININQIARSINIIIQDFETKGTLDENVFSVLETFQSTLKDMRNDNKLIIDLLNSMIKKVGK